MKTFADKGYQGAGGSIRTPFKGHRLRPPLSRHQRSVNRAHARIRACGERAVATLKTWKVLARLAAILGQPDLGFLLGGEGVRRGAVHAVRAGYLAWNRPEASLRMRPSRRLLMLLSSYG